MYLIFRTVCTCGVLATMVVEVQLPFGIFMTADMLLPKGLNKIILSSYFKPKYIYNIDMFLDIILEIEEISRLVRETV